MNAEAFSLGTLLEILAICGTIIAAFYQLKGMMRAVVANTNEAKSLIKDIHKHITSSKETIVEDISDLKKEMAEIRQGQAESHRDHGIIITKLNGK